MIKTREAWWKFCERNSKRLSETPTFAAWVPSEEEEEEVEPEPEPQLLTYRAMAEIVTYRFDGEDRTCLMWTPV